jgi:hypothetical protein
MIALYVSAGAHGTPIVLQTGTSWWQVIPPVASAIAAVAAVYLSLLAHRQQRAVSITGAMLQITERLDSAESAKLKDGIYKLASRREGYTHWSDAERDIVDRWCAHLDLVALLLISKQLEIDAFFAIYGDVTLRTIYIVAPYGNWQRSERGQQFLLPLARVTRPLLKEWRDLAKRSRYPPSIGLKYTGVDLTPESMEGDPHVSTFWRY